MSSGVRSNPKDTITVIGVGMSMEDLTQRHLEIIESADILIGGNRHLNMFESSGKEMVAVTRDLDSLFKEIERHLGNKRMVVLASGDPLHYGIGSSLAEAFGKDKVVFYPNVTALSAAFARLKDRWDDAAWVSFHGRRDITPLTKALRKHDKVAVYTDPLCTPSWLARLLLDLQMTDVTMHVFSKLGSPEESVFSPSLQEAAESDFPAPNMVVLQRIAGAGGKRKIELGTPDEFFEHNDGMITKAEVRAVTLSKLRLRKEHIMWDLGAGSGSVSLEASFFVTEGTIWAVDRDEARIQQIRKNIETFHAENIELIQAVLPRGMDTLPAADRVFVGGGGKALGEILKAALKYAKRDACFVVNTVLMENLSTACDILEQIGMATSVTEVSISRSREMPFGKRLEALNPVWIVQGVRKTG